MQPLAVLITSVFLAGITSAADCAAPDPSNPESLPPATRQLLRDTGYQHFRKGQYQEALVCYTKALKAAEARCPHSPRIIANDLSDLGILTEEMGLYNDSANYFQQELDALRPLGDAAGVDIGEAYMQLGALLLVEGSLDAAEANYRKAVVLLTRHAGADDLRTVKALGGLGRLYAEWGKYQESSGLLHEARTIAEKNTPASDPVLINILDSEAALLCQTHRYAEAERCWLRALKIAERDHGDGGLEYGALLLHLGQLYTAVQDYRAAQEMLERGLAVEQKTKEADTMDSAIAMSALGNVYLQQHKLAQAEALFQQSLGLSNANCEAIPLACAAVKSFLGDFYMAKSKWQSAEAEYQKALTMRETVLGNHLLVASSLVSASRALRKLKRRKEAREYEARAQTILSSGGNAAFNSNNTVDIRSFRAGN